MIRILIVDDSAVLRQSTRFILESDPELRIVGEASNGLDAIQLVEQLNPDVITMDLWMPKMDGVQAIREIMAKHPVPIVVVTSLDLDKELGISKQATRLGALAVLARPSGRTGPEQAAFASKLIEQVKLMSGIKVIRRLKNEPAVQPKVTPEIIAPIPGSTAPRKIEIVAIGSSTGGPAALHKILRALPGNLPVPIVIVQHISFGFVAGLASWLNDISPLAILVGRAGEQVQPGKVYIAPDNHHMLVDRSGHLTLNPAAPVGGHRPSVTCLFESVAQSFGAAALGVILTGMGADGAVGMKTLRDTGAITLAQDEASCIVFGMPKEAIARGAIQHIVPLDQMARSIENLVGSVQSGETTQVMPSISG